MKSLLFLMLLAFSESTAFAQNNLFQNTWIGYNAGVYPTGRYPNIVKTADLDGDGDLDAILTQKTWTTGFGVFINNGNAGFSGPVTYSSLHAVYDVTIADIDNDGDKDVIVSNTGDLNEGTTIGVYRNNGSGVFGTPTNIAVGGGPVGLTAADLDNDGDQDLSVVNFEPNVTNGTVKILVNNGGGSFGAPMSFDAGAKPYKIIAAKINNDNLVDLVIANAGTQKMTVLFNGGNNSFSTKTEYAVLPTVWAFDGNATVQAGDIDNDGDNDILYSSSGTWDGLYHGYVAVFKNNGSGSFGPMQTTELGFSTTGTISMELSDLNNDGAKDLVAVNASGALGDGYQVLLNDGSGGFPQVTMYSAGQRTWSITTGDVDGDGLKDILTADDYSLQMTVHRNLGGGNFFKPAVYATGSNNAGALDAADIDGDGDLDLVASATSIAAVGVPVTVMKNNGNGTFATGIPYTVGGGGVRAKFRDLNGDGKPDLLFASAICCGAYNFHTAMNLGNGTFGSVSTWQLNGCGFSDIDAFDLDGDGDLDVVVTEWLGCQNVSLSARRIFISLNNGSGGFGPPTIKIVNPFPSCLGGADFNGDGRIDLVTGQSLGIDIHLGTGTGDLLAPVTYAVSQSPYDLLIRDLNGDGKLDIAACTEYNYEGMSVLLGNGDGTFQPAQNYDGAFSPDLRNESGITSGDVDGDGDIDLMVSNWASNDMSIYLNNGAGSFQFRYRVGLNYGASHAMFADFDGDGKGDIVAATITPYTGGASGVILLKGLASTNACTGVIAGAAQASSPSTCAGTGISLSLSGNTTGAGINYQWQTATAAGGPWVNMGAGSNSAIIQVNPSATAYYRAGVSCGANTQYSTPVLVSVVPQPPPPVITFNGATITSSAGTGNQWYLNGSAIPGATGITYNPSTFGIYTVRVAVNGCQSIPSNAITFTPTGITQAFPERQLIIAPNPVQEVLTVQIIGNNKRLNVEVFDLSGKQVFQAAMTSEQLQIPVQRWSAGLYLVRVTNGHTGALFHKTVVKE